jgi:HAD superfamily hydrolase (TIGR01509 family)
VKQAVILDIDGTLVDTNYQHVIAWDRAFCRHGVELPIWRIHRAIGKGGDQIVTDLAGEEVEEGSGDAIRESEGEIYSDLIDEVRPLEGAREFIAELKRRDVTVVLASSAKEDEVEHYLDLLEVRELADDWTTSADVEATKPQPDLVEAALGKAGTREAVMVGDTVWDIKAAERAGIPTIAVLSGGFGADELREAGAVALYESVAELADDLDSALNQ